MISVCAIRGHEPIYFKPWLEHLKRIPQIKEINIMLPNKSRSLYLPVILQSEGISDPSDLIAEKGLDALTQFLIQNNIK